MTDKTRQTQQTNVESEATQADPLFRRLADLVARLDACVAKLAAAAAQQEGR